MSTYDALVAAYGDIAAHGGVLNGWGLSPAAEGILLGTVDSVGRPLFTPGVASNNLPQILGASVVTGRGLYKAGAAGVGTAAGTPAVVGVAGDWTNAVYGTVEGVKIDFADQTGLVIASEQVNLWEHNMFGVRAEVEVGFRAEVDCFNRLLGAVPQA